MSNPNEPVEKPEPEPAPAPDDVVAPPIDDKVKSDSEKALEQLKAQKLEFEKNFKNEKLEFKENKQEKAEIKEIKHEKVEFKEHKQEKAEIKEIKHEKVEFKEHKQEKLEIKEIKLEKNEKSEFEVPPDKFPVVDPGPVERQALLAQAEALEESAKQIRHFIDRGERPDLSDGALTNEDDAPGKQD